MASSVHDSITKAKRFPSPTLRATYTAAITGRTTSQGVVQRSQVGADGTGPIAQEAADLLIQDATLAGPRAQLPGLVSGRAAAPEARVGVEAPPGTAPGGGGPASPAGAAAALARGHWSVLAASPLGSRQGPVVAWTGQELLEIGGRGGNAGPGEGAAVDPADGRWRPIAPAPVPVGALAASAWTGSPVVVPNYWLSGRYRNR
jgi:hypothetical protein